MMRAVLTIVMLAMSGMTALAQQTVVGREAEIVDLRLGQRVQVDDGACPAGQIKEILGTKLGPNGVIRSAKCVPRAGSKG